MTESLPPTSAENSQEESNTAPSLTLDTETTAKKVNETALKSYQKYQQKYMEVFGRLQVRKNTVKRWKLQAKLKVLENKLNRIERFLYEE